MTTLNQCMREYQKQLSRGVIQQAYRGLMDYMQSLRSRLAKKHPDWMVSGSLYFGYMDMTYFSVVTSALKEHGLKIAVVFLHEECRFEAWLAAVNKGVQGQYWHLIKESGWDQYRLVLDPKVTDAIIEHTLADNPDFDDLKPLTKKIMSGLLAFMRGVEDLLLRSTSRS